MPNRIPPFQVSDFLAHNTLPIPLSSIPSTSFAEPNCPICKVRYADPPSDYVHPDIGDGQPEVVQRAEQCA
ncbi:predicted protein [Plenodomus lingam JN3]|uniref:Predicted protein n=1 Tax=Leptosphaeria maculans (strain JN3 / isolate v23.1.3 / race Av1-4-5-6-7-8) TaxID=985895 RepID=E4ZTT4_LEPMJ|nr:predicted protein [Plenodomus lingam JN3]CBX94644.1 predicted protein [Plenodomus lingam JN3]